MNPSVLIIAEAGVNHNGSIELALKLIDSAAQAGADVVKFQTFKADSLVTRAGKKAVYQLQTTEASETQHAMLKRLELSESDYHRLARHCDASAIEFMSTPFDERSLRFLVEDLGVKRLKFSSGDLTNAPLLLAGARSGCPLILSTGMANLAEVEAALAVVAFGLLEPKSVPTSADIARAWASEQGYALVRKLVSVLHCTTEYPAPFGDVNLAAMQTMAAAFKVVVGYSDHTEGIVIPIAAAAAGAALVEKHFTLDRNMAGPDHLASIEPDELESLVKAIRIVEQAIGHGRKTPAASEVKNRDIARKSLVSSRAISAGEHFSPENVTVKRPGNGRSPGEFWSLMGCVSDRNYLEDEMIR